MSALVQDLRYGVRVFGRAPGFSATVILTLALGIGANTAIFRVVDAVLLEPLPATRDPGRLIQVSPFSLSHAAFRDLQSTTPELVGLAAFSARNFSRASDTRAELVPGMVVSGNYFEVLGARARLGRTILPADDRPGAPPVVVVSHAFWKSRLDGRTDAVGDVIDLNGRRATVIGVAEDGFRGTRLGAPMLWLPIAAWPSLAPLPLRRNDLEDRTWNWLSLVGRMPSGMSLAQAQAILAAGAARVRQDHPHRSPSKDFVRVQSARSAATGLDDDRPVEQFLAILVGLVAIVLSIACVNVAGLLLARAERRRREMGIRLAIGAGARRLVRQLLTESLLLSVAAGALSLVVSDAFLEALSRFRTADGFSLRLAGTSAGGAAVLFAFGVSLLASVAFGLAPALQASRADVRAALAETSPSPTRSRLRTFFLAGQVALTLVLLVATGLFVRSLQSALAIDPGFRTDHVAVASVNVGLARYDEAAASNFYRLASQELSRLPGVDRVAWTSTTPLTQDSDTESATFEGYRPAPNEEPEVEVIAVSPGYLRTLGIGLLAGRDFDEHDDAGSGNVAIVNEALVRRYGIGDSPLGKVVRLATASVTVVGVARDSKYHTLTETPEPLIYVPLLQRLAGSGLSQVSVLVRSRRDARALLPSIELAIARAGASVPVYDTGTLDDRLADLLLPQRIAASLLGFFSVLALTIAAVGVSGAVATAVGQRTREIGIRVALGARPNNVALLILRRHVLPMGAGIAAGLCMAAVGSRAAAAFLYGVSPTDAATFAAATGVIGACVFAAGWLPLRRAMRIDPTTALRSE